MTIESDRFIEHWRLKERGEEDAYFARRDAQLLERLRMRAAEAQTAGRDRCPDCGAPLMHARRHGVDVAECPQEHGLWVRPPDVETFVARERDGWIERYVYAPSLQGLSNQATSQ